MEKIYQIHSLAEYFSVIEHLQLKNYISRGESKKFPGILSSAFRPFSNTGKYYGQKQLSEYYNYIGNHLTDLQRKHFLAYAQHSGLPTNLVDFTTSPLVSLFFSTYTEEITDTSNGFIYFIHKNRLFPIDSSIGNNYAGNLSKFIGAPPLSLLNTWLKAYDAGTACGALNYSDPDFKEDYVHMLLSFLQFPEQQLQDYAYTSMSLKLTALCINLKKQITDLLDQPEGFMQIHEELLKTFHKFYKLFNQGSAKEDILRTEYLLDYFDGCGLDDMYFNDSFVPESLDNCGMHPISIPELLNILIVIAKEFAVYSTRRSYYLPFYASYTPANISGRVSIQNSVFICQTYLEGTRTFHQAKPENVLVTQEICPDITLEICDKSRIQEELDMVGINLKTIYGDDDNIAKYIKNKL